MSLPGFASGDPTIEMLFLLTTIFEFAGLEVMGQKRKTIPHRHNNDSINVGVRYYLTSSAKE